MEMTSANNTERARIAVIVALPEAAGREALATHLATSTDMTVDQVRAALAAAPIDSATISAMWSSALASRGLKTGAAGEASTSAPDGDRSLRSRGMQVG
jgi:hypothetical protein